MSTNETTRNMSTSTHEPYIANAMYLVSLKFLGMFLAVIGTRGDQDAVVEMREKEIVIRSATNKVDFSGGNVYELLRGTIKNDQHGEQKDLKEN